MIHLATYSFFSVVTDGPFSGKHEPEEFRPSPLIFYATYVKLERSYSLSKFIPERIIRTMIQRQYNMHVGSNETTQLNRYSERHKKAVPYDQLQTLCVSLMAYSHATSMGTTLFLSKKFNDGNPNTSGCLVSALRCSLRAVIQQTAPSVKDIMQGSRRLFAFF